MGISAGFAVLYVYTAELFPTKVIRTRHFLSCFKNFVPTLYTVRTVYIQFRIRTESFLSYV